MKRWALVLALILGIAVVPSRAEWEVVRYEGMEYVTLKSFCEFYKLGYTPVGDQEYFKARGKGVEVVFRRGSREVMINGVKHWLSFSLEAGAHDWLISRRDLAKLFEPVLRPEVATEGREWKGVVIDPGHGGDDRGAVSRRGKREKDCTLDTALRLEKALKEKGIAVAMTRRTDVFIELEERARRAARYPDYLFVSIHFNDATGSARGIETYCLAPWGGGSTDAGGRVYRFNFQKLPGNENDLLNIILGNYIHQEVIQALNPGDSEADRGVKRARFVVLKENTLPAVLVEGGFLSNRQEASRIETPEYRQKLADAIARGIQLFMRRGKPLDAPAKTTPVTSTNTVTNTVAKTKPPVAISTNTPPAVPAPVAPVVKPMETSPAVSPPPTETNTVEPEVILYPVQPRAPQPELRPEPTEPAPESSPHPDSGTSTNAPPVAPHPRP